MAKRTTKLVNQVTCDRGVTYVDCAGLTAVYRYRWWWVRVNPRLLFPSLRKDHRKFIVVNGKRKGWGEVRSGLIPLSRYDIPGTGIAVALQRFVRTKLGLGLRKYERGYIYIAIGPYRYVVVQHTSREGLRICEVYDKRTEDQIGTFIFNKEFTEVYQHVSRDGVINTMSVIIGYVADSMIYSLAAGMLQRNIKIII